MPLFTLTRIAVRDDGAFGVLKHHLSDYDVAGIPFAVTLERTYLNPTEAGISQKYLSGQLVKVTEGRHVCVRRFYNKGGYFTYEIQQDGHTAILFHRGSIEAHSEGCVLVGERFDLIPMQNTPGISDGSGLTELLRLAADRPSFELEVRSA
jgi:uncharacterized protein DUF5675